MDSIFANQTNKENNYISTNKELQRLKVQLNDKIFDINKLQEDYSQEKAKHLMEFQKEKNHLNKIIKELKQKNQQDNDQWSKKIEEYRSVTKEQISKMTVLFDENIEKQRVKIRNQCYSKFQKQMTTLSNQIQVISVDYKQKINKLLAQKQQMCKSLSNNHAQQMNRRDQEYKQVVETIKKQYENKITILQNLYIAQQQQKTTLTKKHQNFVHDSIKTIIERQKQIQSIKIITVSLQKQIVQFKAQIQKLKSIQLHNKQRNQQRIKEFNLSKMKDIKKMMDQFQIKYDLQKVSYEQQTKKIKNEVDEMRKIYQQKQKKWDQRGEMILKTIEANTKKADSFQTIRHLQVEIVKKDSLLKRQRENLKNCQLNLQNMEQIYDKMFVSNNYLYKSRSKSYKIKNNRLKTQLNQNNNSTFIEERFCTQPDK